jgi:transcriptional regulator
MTNKGRRARGSQLGQAKLTEAKVIELRRLREEGWTYNRLAARYQVTRAAVIWAVQRKTWAHV